MCSTDSTMTASEADQLEGRSSLAVRRVGAASKRLEDSGEGHCQGFVHGWLCCELDGLGWMGQWDMLVTRVTEPVLGHTWMLPRSQTRNSAASSTVMKLRRRPSQCRICAIAYVSALCEKSSSPRFFAPSNLFAQRMGACDDWSDLHRSSRFERASGEV